MTLIMSERKFTQLQVHAEGIVLTAIVIHLDYVGVIQ